ncbi:hypothetical protein CQW23_32187 [Capsicum baccatum]|uniref:Uncharacterized protein n=1 Tax=Capsicum baccatum TaxID=33114 RepID=A0A2G2V5F1_CAPBA|nr:hypothetical protein CQW23_32187 [Capsicum baccatum]
MSNGVVTLFLLHKIIQLKDSLAYGFPCDKLFVITFSLKDRKPHFDSVEANIPFPNTLNAPTFKLSVLPQGFGHLEFSMVDWYLVVKFFRLTHFNLEESDLKVEFGFQVRHVGLGDVGNGLVHQGLSLAISTTHLSAIVNNNNAVGEYVERKKRIPKENPYYKNSEFLIEKDRLPSKINKKLKQNVGGKKDRALEKGLIAGDEELILSLTQPQKKAHEDRTAQVHMMRLITHLFSNVGYLTLPHIPRSCQLECGQHTTVAQHRGTKFVRFLALIPCKEWSLDLSQP